MEIGARIDDSKCYRYRLWRHWSEEPLLGFCMLNPSTADAEVDDPTIRRCIGFAQRGGYGGIEVCNLFALRATDPAELFTPRLVPDGSRHYLLDPIGPENDAAILECLDRSEHIVCAWGGRKGNPLIRAKQVLHLLGKRIILHLGLTQNGMPRHPLYLPNDTQLVKWAAQSMLRRLDR